MRRFVSNLAAQQWTLVFIDLMVVIVGVFIGIEAANWNQRRQDRQEEQRYIQQIIANLDADLKSFDVAQERSIANDNAAEFVLSGLADRQLVERQPGRFAVAILRSGFLYIPEPARQTYDELISTGNLRLLRDSDLKASMSRYYSMFDENRQWDAMVRQQQSDYWTETAGILPRPAQKTVMHLEEPALSPAEVGEIIDRAQRRPRLPDLLRAMAVHQEWVRRNSRRLAGETRQLRALLKNQLSKA